jgi:hypothetical protein
MSCTMALNSKATRSGPLRSGLRQRPNEFYDGSEYVWIAENIALPLELSRQSTRSVSGRSWAQMPQVAFACLLLDSMPGRASVGTIVFAHSLAAGRYSLSKRSTWRSVVLIHGPFGYEPNTLTTAPIWCKCNSPSAAGHVQISCLAMLGNCVPIPKDPNSRIPPRPGIELGSSA